MTKPTAILLSIAAFLLLSVGSAFASTGQICHVKMIGYNEEGTSTTNIYLSCTEDYASHTYVAYSNPATGVCGQRLTFDGVKIMESMVTAAWLSGKPLTLWWITTGCTGNNRGIVAMNFGS